MKNLLHGDLGVSYKKTGVSVNTIIAQGLPNTVSLGLSAFVFSLIVGVVIYFINKPSFLVYTCLRMIVHNLNVKKIISINVKTNAILNIDANAILSLTITMQHF